MVDLPHAVIKWLSLSFVLYNMDMKDISMFIKIIKNKSSKTADMK